MRGMGIGAVAGAALELDREKRLDPRRRSLGVRFCPAILRAAVVAVVGTLDVDMPRGRTDHELSEYVEGEVMAEGESEASVESSRVAHRVSEGWSEALGPQSKSSAIWGGDGPDVGDCARDAADSEVREDAFGLQL